MHVVAPLHSVYIHSSPTHASCLSHFFTAAHCCKRHNDFATCVFCVASSHDILLQKSWCRRQFYDAVSFLVRASLFLFPLIHNRTLLGDSLTLLPSHPRHSYTYQQTNRNHGNSDVCHRKRAIFKVPFFYVIRPAHWLILRELALLNAYSL